MYRTISILVIAVFAVSAQRDCKAQGADNPIRDVAVWMERAENAAKECEGLSRDIMAVGLAEVYALSGDIDHCQTWLDTVGEELTRVPGGVVAYKVIKTGNLNRAMEIADRQKKGLHQDHCYRFIGKGLAELHRFDEAREIIARIEDADVRSKLMETIALGLAHAGKWEAAKSLMKQIEPPALWGDNITDLVVDDAFVKALVPIPVDDDPEMAAAIEQARQRLDHFIEELTNPNTVSVEYSVRVLVEVGDVAEHLWLDSVRYENGNFIGRICRDLEKIDSLEFGDEISIAKDKASDWRYYRKEKEQYVGYFTSEVEYRREQLAIAWNTINDCETNKTQNPPELQAKGVSDSYRRLSGTFYSTLSTEDWESPQASAAEISDPESRSNFWRKVAWHEINADDRHAAIEALQESVAAASEIADPANQSSYLVFAADAYLERGDVDTARSLVKRVKSSDDDATALLKRFTHLFSGPLTVGVFIRAGEVELVFSTLATVKDDNASPIWSIVENNDTSLAWIAFGSFCAVYDQLDFVESHFENLPTSASKACVALGVVEGLNEVERD